MPAQSPPGRIRFGTSSWSEKAWGGVFYPAGLPAGEQLGIHLVPLRQVLLRLHHPAPLCIGACELTTPGSGLRRRHDCPAQLARQSGQTHLKVHVPLPQLPPVHENIEE